MAEITEILNQFPEEILQNTLNGKIISGELKWENNPILLFAEQFEANQILFSINGKPLRISTNDDINGFISDNDKNSSFFQNIFWIQSKELDNVEIRFLKCGNGQKFNSSLEIGFGDNIILNNKNIKIDKLSDNLTKEFVFTSESSNYIFIQTYPGNSEQSFTIYGSKKRADIIVIENKWIVQKITNKPFPRKHIDFLLLNVAQYQNIEFVEASKAKEAYETIQSEQLKGNTLISLWQTYSAIEFERANQLKEKVGELQFSRVRYLADGITKVKINKLTEEVNSVINENKEDLLNISLEVIAVVEDSLNPSKRESYILKSVNNDGTFDLYDELNSVPQIGSFTISLIGNEIVKKRREKALKSLREDRKFITRNLLFAIEGAADAMLDKKRKEKALTERTKKFLKDKFGIDDLTQNQRDAVEIAINTPDIAIIQGPPGTGKSTVVAAICDRLIEISEKGKKNYNGKLILVSAFQNDTVEHIASKIYTLGLPTIKIGKETQSNIRTEDKFISEMKLQIDKTLHSLSSKSSINSHSLKTHFLSF